MPPAKHAVPDEPIVFSKYNLLYQALMMMWKSRSVNKTDWEVRARLPWLKLAAIFPKADARIIVAIC